MGFQRSIFISLSLFRHTKLENSEERMEIDGLNSLKYDIVKTEEHPLYTQVVVDVVERSEKELERSV